MTLWERLNKHTVPFLSALVFAMMGVLMVIYPDESGTQGGRHGIIATLMIWLWSRPLGILIIPIALLVAWNQIRIICTPEVILRAEDRKRLP